MDFVEGLPLSRGVDSILVVVDRLSKYAHFIGLRHPFTAVSVAESFIKEVVRLHGFPSSIVSDRDRVFLSIFWKELFRLQGTHLKRSTAYHPQTDGQTEVVNKRLEAYLRCFTSTQPRAWAKWLAWAEYSYNSAPHSSTKMSPFKVVYGRDPPPVIKYNRGDSTVGSIEEGLQERDLMLDELRFNLVKSQQHMREVEDQKRRDVELKEGDMVYLKLQPYRQKSLAKRPFEKLAARFYGPFQIIQKVGKVAYKLQLPLECKLHPVFHISQLKAAVGSNISPVNIPTQLTTDLELVVEPEELRRVRTVRRNGEAATEVLVKWKGLSEFEATWEDANMINLRFPDFHLEDKVSFLGGSIAIPQHNPLLIQTYTRREKKLTQQDKGEVEPAEPNITAE